MNRFDSYLLHKVQHSTIPAHPPGSAGLESAQVARGIGASAGHHGGINSYRKCSYVYRCLEQISGGLL